MLYLYVLKHFLKVFIVVNFIFLGVVVSYALIDVFTAFKEKSLSLLVDYLYSLSLYAFFHLLSLSFFISLVVFFRRVFAKKLDLITQSFGIPPIKFVLPVLGLLLISTALNIGMIFDVYPSIKKHLFQIEKEYKKKQEYETSIIENFWIAMQEKETKRFINFKVVDIKNESVYDAFVVDVRDKEIVKVITANKGQWQKDRVFLESATIEDLLEGKRETTNVDLKIVEIDSIKDFGEKIDHLSVASLILLYITTKGIGLNEYLYLYEIVIRLTIALSPLLSTLIALNFLVKHREFKAAFVSFLTLVFYLLLVVSVQKLMAERLGVNPFYSVVFAVPLVVFSLKSLYNLSKGFRV